MRITFLFPPPNMSGGTKVIAIYIKYLLKNGHIVNLVSTPSYVKPKLISKLKNWSRLNFFYPKVQASYFDESVFQELGLNRYVIDSRRKVVDADVPDADVVVATWWETAEWLDGLSMCKGKKVYFIQGHEIFSPIPRERAVATYKSDSHKIVVSNWLKNILEIEYGVKHLELIPNAIFHDVFYPSNRKKNLNPTIGFLINESHVKGLDIALSVLKELKKTYPTITVVTFGSSKLKNISLNEYDISFSLLPQESKIREIYTSCDVWLAPSRSEGFNLTAMEAMACGTPVVSTKTGWPVESIIPYKNGILTEIDDVQELVNGVKWFLEQSEMVWKDCSERAAMTVKSYSWEKSALKLESILLKLCSSKD